jgi:hypothetical protein
MRGGKTEWWIVSFNNDTFRVGGGSSEHGTVTLFRCALAEFEPGFAHPLYGP